MRRLWPALALASPAQFLQAHQQADGGFAESGGHGLAGTHGVGGARPRRGRTAPAAGRSTTFGPTRVIALPPATRALVALAEAALGDPRSPAGSPTSAGQTNTIVWTILARRQAGLDRARSRSCSALLARQAKSGGWGWAKGVAPDSNDTAAAVQALRAAGVSGAPVRRALDYLR